MTPRTTGLTTDSVLTRGLGLRRITGGHVEELAAGVVITTTRLLLPMLRMGTGNRHEEALKDVCNLFL